MMPFSRWNADSLFCAASSVARASFCWSVKKPLYWRAGSTRSSMDVSR